jgi:hypothetical protein
MMPLRAIRLIDTGIAFVIAIAFVVAIGAASASADPFTPRRASDTSQQTSRFDLQDFSELRRLEAGRELRALSRDADRKVEERQLRSEGSRADVERYRQRARAEEELDRLTARYEADALAPGSGFERFGPETRRVLERSQIELRWVQRRHDLELRLHELERSVTDREPAGASPLQPLPRW